MKKFWVCCFAALCLTAAGCNGDRPQAEKPPEQEVQAEPPAEPETEATAATDPYAGTWRDSGASSCRMEISCADGGGYTIEISLSQSSTENTVWQLTGTYDEDWNGIAYTGAKYEETTSDSGAVQRTPVPEREEISGLISLEDDGALHWLDDFDHAGDDLRFEREQPVSEAKGAA